MCDQIAMLCDSSAIIANNNIKLAFCVSETDKQWAFEHIHIGFIAFYCYYCRCVLAERISHRIRHNALAAQLPSETMILFVYGNRPPFYSYMSSALHSHRFQSYFRNPFRVHAFGEPLEKLVIHRPRSESMRSSSSSSSARLCMAAVLADDKFIQPRADHMERGERGK